MKPSDVVCARNALWQVVSLEEGRGCCAFRLVRVSPPAGMTRTFIDPFDHIHPAPLARAPIVVTRAAAAVRALAVCADDREWRTPAAAASHSAVDLLSWQLVPALALFTGHHRRVLVADDVGLGKTVQAGIAIREVLRRWPHGRVLILVPAGLRVQWQRELKSKFEVDAVVADLEWIQAQKAATALGANPWAEAAVVIASLDFAKRQEVLPGAEQLSWNVVVIDEAHGLGEATDRASLAEAVGRRARHLLLLTGTPHDGDDDRFSALRGLGSIPDEPEPLFLRRRASSASSSLSRRWRIWRLRPSAEERCLSNLLDKYVSALERGSAERDPRAVRLLTHVLRKRAASSPLALLRTLVARRTWLQSGAPPAQPMLPHMLDDDVGDEVPETWLQLPGLRQPRAEMAWLGAVADAARRVAHNDSKVRTLRRLLERVAEPVLVFTEYRDSLAYLEAKLKDLGPRDVLHGGRSPRERQEAVERFASGRARVLLATDAASEGLNLQERCRLVVMLDLPWTPARVWQRIGRLDRHGQRRRVHAIGLSADTSFSRWLESRLMERVERIARALMACGEGPPPELHDAAAHEYQRLVLRRRLDVRLTQCLTRCATAAALRSPQRPLGCVDTLAVTCLRPSLGARWSGVLAIVDAELVADEGSIDRTVLGLHVPIPVPRLRSRREVRVFVAEAIMPLEGELLRRARSHLHGRWQRSSKDWTRFHAVARQADNCARSAARPRAPLVQPSLFGSYDTASRPVAPGSLAAPLPPDGDWPRHERVGCVLLFLRPGPGHLSPPTGRDP